MCFPEEDMVYDYRLDDAGASRKDDEEEEEDRKVSDAPGQDRIGSEPGGFGFDGWLVSIPPQVQWVSWMDSAKSIVITPETNYADIIVPTADTIRMSFLMDKLLTNKKPVSASVQTHRTKQTFLSFSCFLKVVAVASFSSCVSDRPVQERP